MMAVAGVLLSGFCVGGLQKANLGTDPYTCFVTGIANVLHMSYGKCFPILTAILIVIILILNGKLMGIATIINCFFTGTAAQIMKNFLDHVVANDSVIVRWGIFGISIAFVSLAAAIYYTADLGVSSYDAVAITCSEKYRISSFRICRIVCDLCCCIVGYAFHATLGIGTVVTALLMGPVIQICKDYLTEPFLYGSPLLKKREVQ